MCLIALGQATLENTIKKELAHESTGFPRVAQDPNDMWFTKTNLVLKKILKVEVSWRI